MEKIIFLDIDGVLNNRTTRTRNVHGALGMNVALVQIFRRVVAETGAKVVLSSTWRLYKDLIGDIKKHLGPEIEIIGQTPDLSWQGTTLYHSRERGDEIADWIEKNGPVSNFAIIDDASDMGKYRNSPNFFQTNFDVGLTEEIAEEMIDFLGKAE